MGLSGEGYPLAFFRVDQGNFILWDELMEVYAVQAEASLWYRMRLYSTE